MNRSVSKKRKNELITWVILILLIQKASINLQSAKETTIETTLLDGNFAAKTAGKKKTDGNISSIKSIVKVLIMCH